MSLLLEGQWRGERPKEEGHFSISNLETHFRRIDSTYQSRGFSWRDEGGKRAFQIRFSRRRGASLGKAYSLPFTRNSSDGDKRRDPKDMDWNTNRFAFNVRTLLVLLSTSWYMRIVQVAGSGRYMRKCWNMERSTDQQINKGSWGELLRECTTTFSLDLYRISTLLVLFDRNISLDIKRKPSQLLEILDANPEPEVFPKPSESILEKKAR